MTSQDRWLLGLRIIVLACIITLAALTVNMIASPGVRAPLLTMMGGVTITLTLYPPRVNTIQEVVQDIIALIGTGIAVAGGMNWLFDAVQKSTPDNLLEALSLVILLATLLSLYVFISILIFADWSGIRRDIKTVMRTITRR